MSKIAAAALRSAVIAGLAVLAGALRANASTEAHLYLAQGEAQLDRGQWDPAIHSFERATQANGGCSAYFMLGWAHYQRGFASGDPATADKQDAQETVNAYMMALALDPKLRSLAKPYALYQSLAMAYEALGSQEKAADAYKKAFAFAPADPLLPLYAARLRLEMGQNDKAVANMTLALKKAKAARQEAKLVRLVKTDPLFAPMLADPVLAGMVGAPVRIMAQPRTETFVALKDLPANGGLRDSVKDTVVIARAPKVSAEERAITDRLAFGNDQYKLGRYRAAIDAYNDALTLNQESGSLSQGQMGFVYERIGAAYNRLGLAPEAIRTLRKAVERLPMDSAADYELALAYSVTGHFQEALKSLKECFGSTGSTTELRRFMIQAKTDAELEPLRDMPAFASLVSDYSERAHVASASSEPLPLR